MKTILVVALDGVMDSGLAILLDTLRAAQRLRGRPGGLRVLVAGHRKRVRTGGGLGLETDLRFREAAEGGLRPDWIVVPGLGLSSEAEVAARFRRTDAAGALALLRWAPARTRIGAACSAVFLLAEAGLLEGRRATTTWWLAEAFRARYPEVRLDEGPMLVRDGRCLTAGAAFAQLDLSLALVAEVLGRGVADRCASYLLMEARPSQTRYMAPTHRRHGDPAVGAAERWIDAHLGAPFQVADLAAAVALSPRTLARRVLASMGLSPLKWVQRRRLLRAAHLIETTDLAIDAVAAEVGYQDGTALRKLVKREFGTTPSALRR